MALQKMGALIALMKLSLILSYLHKRWFEAYLKEKYEKEWIDMQEKRREQIRLTIRLTINDDPEENNENDSNTSTVLPSEILLPNEKTGPQLSNREVFSFESFKKMYDGYHH